MQRVSQFLRAVAVTGLVALAVVGAPSVASAHTDLDYTLPADGEQAATPVSEITVAFDDPVTLVGAGFEVLTPEGVVVAPAVFSEDGAVYFLEVAEPLAGGVAAVRYEVAAADGHVLEGGFSFTVPALPVATTAPATPAPSTAAAGTSPGTSLAPPPVTSAPAVATSAVTATTEPVVIAPAPTNAVVDDDDGGGSGGILIGVVAAVVVAGVAFLLVRSRMSPPS